MRIRSYQDTDEAQVVSLWQIASNAPTHNNPLQDIHRKLRVRRKLLLRCDRRGLDHPGRLLAGYDGHRGWIYYVAVHPQHRRKRIHTALVEDARKLN